MKALIIYYWESFYYDRLMSKLLIEIHRILLREYPLTVEEIADRIGTDKDTVRVTIYKYGDNVIDILEAYRPYKYKVYGF